MSGSIIPKGFVGEQYSDDVALIFKPSETLVSKETKHQQVDIVRNDTYGKILFLDNLLMKTDKDGHIINEMIVHVPMRTGKEKSRVLVVGGGEGFTATQLLNYPELDRIDIVDIDGEFVDIAREFYPEQTSSFENDKVTLHIIEGLEFIKTSKDTYDIIFVTSTDPAGLSAPLFTGEFYQECANHLSDDGIFMTDAYMPFYQLGEIDYAHMHNLVEEYYPNTKLYTCTVPSFPGGLFAFVIGSKKYDPSKDIRKNAPNIKTRYYTEELHSSCFSLPEFMRRRLENST